MSLFKDPDLDFQENYVRISGNNTGVITYFYSDPSLLHYPEKNINFPESDVEFDLSESDITNILKAASVLQAPDLAVERSDDNIVVKVFDRKVNLSSNTYTLNVGKVSESIKKANSTFSLLFKIENIKIMAGSYRVSLSKRKIARFQSSSSLIYYVSLEKDSTWA